MNWNRIIICFFVCWMVSVALSCTSSQPEDTLYDELGGLDTLELVTDTWIDSLKTDPMVSGYFAPLFADSIATLNFRNHLIDQFCALSGGPCVYKGRTMRNTHAGMNIQAEEFDAAIQDLRDALGVWSISDDVSTRFLSRILFLQPEIVGQ
jgi:hemoglobin